MDNSFSPDSGNLAFVQQRQETRHNKFIYAEFDGSKGYDLLSDILAAILPTSRHLTWLALTRVQKDEKPPYGGVGYLMKARARSDRKVEMDLKAFKDAGLMVTSPGIEYIAGQARRVDYKDFSNLYRLAHKYYLWTHTNDFLLYQPSFEDAESIRRAHLADLSENTRQIVAPHQSLYHFLIQFENYHLKLECGKPGRKSKAKASTPIEERQSEECITVVSGHFKQKPKYLFNGPTPYESISMITDSVDDSNLLPHAECRCEECITGTRVHIVENPKCLFNGPTPYESIPTITDSLDDSNRPQTLEKPLESRKRVKEASIRFKASASQEEASAQRTGLPSDEHENERTRLAPDQATSPNGKNDNKELYEKSKVNDGLRRKYPKILRLCTHFAGKFRDMGGKGTLTDIYSLFERSKMPEENFIDLMEYAGRKTAGVPESAIKVRNLDGLANKMPLFMSIIRKAITAGLQVTQLEEADRRCAEEREQARLVEAEPADFSHADVSMSNNQDILPSNHQAAQISEVLASQLSEDLPAPPSDALSTTEEPMVQPAPSDDHDRQRGACREIGFLTSLPIYRAKACECGNTIMCVYKRNMRCVSCNPPEIWGDYLRARVQKILRSPKTDLSVATKAGPIAEIEEVLLTVQDTVILVEQNCCFCPCPILIQGVDLSGNDGLFCIACQPDPAWSSHITAHIQSILGICGPDRASTSMPSRIVSDAEQIALMNDLKKLATRGDRDRLRRR